jgi:hypothetical protein
MLRIRDHMKRVVEKLAVFQVVYLIVRVTLGGPAPGRTRRVQRLMHPRLLQRQRKLLGRHPTARGIGTISRPIRSTHAKTDEQK